jgi:hypothetical protein
MAQDMWSDQLESMQLERQLREGRRQRQQAENEQRLLNHKLKVDRLRRARELAEVKQPPPLDFLAIGDSWFEYPLDGNYPVPPFSFGIIADQQLGSMGNPNPIILSQAHHGQASTAELSYENQEQIIGVLTDPTQWANGKGPDAILVSAGGDDIAGDQLAIYLTYGGGKKKVDARFQGVLDLVQASYQDLFALRDIFAKDVPIFAHCYDYALPNGIPAALILGPWLKPSFDFALYSSADAQQVVRDMIDKFHDMLIGLASVGTNKFTVLDTRNTIKPNNIYPNGWANELHPYPAGFNAAAQKFLAALQAAFHGRI